MKMFTRTVVKITYFCKPIRHELDNMKSPIIFLYRHLWTPPQRFPI